MGRGADAHNVRDALPFGLLIGLGMACSLAAIVIGRPASAATPVTDLPDSSAATVASSNGLPTVVTDPLLDQRAPATLQPPDTLPLAEVTPAAEEHGTGHPVTGDDGQGTRDDAPPRPAATRTLPAAVTEQRIPLADADKAATLLAAMNDARLAAGLPALDRDGRVDEVAAARAASLVADGYFDHYGPDGSSAFSELTARGIPYRLAGENLARNNYGTATTARVAFEALMASPGHRANILEPRYGRAGIAVVRDGRFWLYVTVFAD